MEIKSTGQLFIITIKNESHTLWKKQYFLFFFLGKISVYTKMNHVILLVSVHKNFYSLRRPGELEHHLFKYRKLFESASLNETLLECQWYIFSTYMFVTTSVINETAWRRVCTIYIVHVCTIYFPQKYTHGFNKITLLFINWGTIC